MTSDLGRGASPPSQLSKRGPQLRTGLSRAAFSHRGGGRVPQGANAGQHGPRTASLTR